MSNLLNYHRIAIEHHHILILTGFKYIYAGFIVGNRAVIVLLIKIFPHELFHRTPDETAYEGSLHLF